MTIAQRAIWTMRILMAGEDMPHGHTRSPMEAARAFCARYPEMASKLLDTIGSWPSSETELRAIQCAWHG